MTDDLTHLDFDADPELVELAEHLAQRQADIDSCDELLARYDAYLTRSVGLRGDD